MIVTWKRSIWDSLQGQAQEYKWALESSQEDPEEGYQEP